MFRKVIQFSFTLFMTLSQKLKPFLKYNLIFRYGLEVLGTENSKQRLI